MKKHLLIFLALISVLLSSCTNLGKNLNDLSSFRMSPLPQVSVRQAQVGVIITNKIDWEGDSYKFGELDRLMERQVCNLLAQQQVKAVPYTGNETVSNVIEVNITQDFNFMEIGGSAGTDILALAITEYASLGFYCAVKLELITQASGKVIMPSHLDISEQTKSHVEKHAGANAWSTIFAGNYAINSKLVSMLSQNSPAISQCVSRLLNRIPNQSHAAAPVIEKTKLKPTHVKLRRVTDNLPDFSELRPHG